VYNHFLLHLLVIHQQILPCLVYDKKRGVMMKKEFGQMATALIAVLFGVFALIQFVSIVEIIIGLLSLTFGIVALIWTYRALHSLSKGTSLREYTGYFFFSLLFIFLYSLWDTLIILFEWKNFLIYPKYFLLTIAYLVFCFAAYKILYLGKQFGFTSQVKNMNLTKKKTKRKKN